MTLNKSKKVKPNCLECGSRQTLFRRTTRTHWCRLCGAEFDIAGNIIIKGSLVKEKKEE